MTAPLVQQPYEQTPEPATGRRLASYCDALKLTGGTHLEAIVPTGANLVIISCSQNFYIKQAAGSPVAAVPAATVTDGSASEYIQSTTQEEGRTFICVPGQKISLVTVADAIATFAWFF